MKINKKKFKESKIALKARSKLLKELEGQKEQDEIIRQEKFDKFAEKQKKDTEQLIAFNNGQWKKQLKDVEQKYEARLVKQKEEYEELLEQQKMDYEKRIDGLKNEHASSGNTQKVNLDNKIKTNESMIKEHVDLKHDLIKDVSYLTEKAGNIGVLFKMFADGMDLENRGHERMITAKEEAYKLISELRKLAKNYPKKYIGISDKN